MGGLLRGDHIAPRRARLAQTAAERQRAKSAQPEAELPTKPAVSRILGERQRPPFRPSTGLARHHKRRTAPEKGAVHNSGEESKKLRRLP